MILRTTSQPRSRSTALLVGEPLAKPDTRWGLPRPLLQGEVAMRSIDGEVVSKLRLEKKKRTAKLCSAKFMLHALLEEISANEDKARTFTQKRPVCSAGSARHANGFPFEGGAGCTADGEGYPLKMGALRAGNAESTTRDFE